MRALSALTLVVLFALNSVATAAEVSVAIKVVLLDSELNQKPVPRLRIIVKPALQDEIVADVRTSFEGIAAITLGEGTYVLETPDGVDFAGSKYRWAQSFEVSGQPLTLELSNDNANVAAAPRVRVVDELTTLFKQLEPAVVTVWSDSGHGTGFLIDRTGLILTNEHVVGKPTYLAVQFDETRKVAAHLLMSDSANDVAVIWANLANIAGEVPDGVTPLKIAQVAGSEPSLVPGERVFTIGSPLSQRKIVTTGIASKIEDKAIISDININPGNSGGPLFNSGGEVVGITTFGEQGQAGPGVSGIVRIEIAVALLDEARKAMSSLEPPSPNFLPVEPTKPYPIEALKAAISNPRFDDRPYYFSAGSYHVAVLTPVATYWAKYKDEMEVAKERQNRKKKHQQASENVFRPLDELRNWQFYVGEYRPVIHIFAQPKLRETAWSAVGRGIIAGAAAYGGTYANLPPAKMRFTTDFYQMRLFCGPREVPPIHPGRESYVLNVKDHTATVTDATYYGAYSYPPDAISPSCGFVRLQLFSEKNPAQPQDVVLRPETVQRIAADFAPYHAASAPGPLEASSNSVVPPVSIVAGWSEAQVIERLGTPRFQGPQSGPNKAKVMGFDVRKDKVLLVFIENGLVTRTSLQTPVNP